MFWVQIERWNNCGESPLLTSCWTDWMAKFFSFQLVSSNSQAGNTSFQREFIHYILHNSRFIYILKIICICKVYLHHCNTDADASANPWLDYYWRTHTRLQCTWRASLHCTPSHLFSLFRSPVTAAANGFNSSSISSFSSFTSLWSLALLLCFSKPLALVRLLAKSQYGSSHSKDLGLRWMLAGVFISPQLQMDLKPEHFSFDYTRELARMGQIWWISLHVIFACAYVMYVLIMNWSVELK